MLKKTTSIFLSGLLVSSIFSSSVVSAEGIGQKTIKNTEIEEPISLSEEEFTYEYNGVVINHPVSMNDQELMEFYEMISNPTDYLSFNSLTPSTYGNQLLTPFAVQLPPGGAQITSGPFYKTYSNLTERVAVGVIANWAGGKLKISKERAKKLAQWGLTFGAIAGSEIISPTYVGVWNYEAYDSSQGRYRIYTTLVHYRWGNYTSPMKVQTYPLT